ncbi:MAG: hypothetical protein IPM48_09170 [Saprospiraceae bacterium]|nr:hypothetical protein [Saprospiraceae bacterium]
MNPLSPHSFSSTKENDRIHFMDALRGFAILGIFIANLGTGFSGYNPESTETGPFLIPEWDRQMLFLHHIFLEGKFYSIFSLLFGWGIALQIYRGESNGLDPIPLIRRRLAFMLLLGAIHLMLWPGDIVFFYGLLAFLLLPLRRFSNKTLLIIAAFLILSPIVLYAAKAQWSWLNAPAGLFFSVGEKLSEQLTGINSNEAYQEWEKTAGWWDLFKANLAGFFFDMDI